MTKIYLIIGLLVVSFSGVLKAQSVGFSYQAVALDRSKAEGFGRDTDGEILASADIEVRFTISENEMDGDDVYQEEHRATTDVFGMFRLIVGRGEPLMASSLDELDWGNVAYFLHVEINLEGSYEYMGVEELLGAPYALNVRNQTLSLNGNVISISNGNQISLLDNDAANEIQDLSLAGDELMITNNATASTIDLSRYMDDTNTQLTELEVDDFVSDNGFLTTEVDGSVTNELQDISTTGAAGDITLSSGATLALNVDDADADVTNELQDISTTGAAGDITLSSGATLALNVDDADADVTNELQDISTTGAAGDITLSSGATLALNVDDADADVTNELQDISTTGAAGDITLSSGATLALNVDDADADVTNELQDISTTGAAGDITLSSGATLALNVDDADADVTNEIQDLQLTGNSLAITNNATPTTIDLTKYNVFTTATGVTSNAPGTVASDDFVFGSTQLDDSGDSDEDKRVFFDKSKAAFRAGGTDGSEWDDVNVGIFSGAFGYQSEASAQYSFATGLGTTSSGGVSFATGQNTEASGNISFASGVSSQASGSFAFASGDHTISANTASFSIGSYTHASGVGAVAAGINTTSPSYAETVLGSFNTSYAAVGTGNFIGTDRLFVLGNGTSVGARADALVVYKDGNATLSGVFTHASDQRLKSEITSIAGSLSAIGHLRGVHYKWNDIKTHDMEHLQTGLIAQEVRQIFPELVHEGSDGYLSVNYVGLIPHLIEAVKQLKQENELLKTAIEGKNKTLEERMSQIESILSQLNTMSTE